MAQLRLCCGVRFNPHGTPMWARIKWEGIILVLFAERLPGQLISQVEVHLNTPAVPKASLLLGY